MQLDSTISAVITGGASGLGAATARRLAAHGVKVALFDLNEVAGEALAKELGGVFCLVDVTKEDSVDAGFAKSRDMARQLVRHGHITVNGVKVDIPSYRVSANDIVEVRQASRELTPFVVAHAELGERPVPAWLEVIPSRMRVLVHSLPERGAIDTQVQEQLIVELYSK